MNKKIIAVVLVVFVVITISLFSNSNKESENKKLIETESVEKTNETIIDVNKEMVVNNNANVLDLSEQNLTKAPDDIFIQVALTELNLANNKIGGSLQAEVRLLENLKVLDLSNNNFTGVPAEVGQLAKLEVLNLANNKITGLPLELGNLKSIKEIDLRGNAYSKQDLDSIKAKLPTTVVILVD